MLSFNKCINFESLFLSMTGEPLKAPDFSAFFVHRFRDKERVK